MDIQVQSALHHRCDLFVAEEKNWAIKLDRFNDGADVYGATFWRCWLQFFFYQHFPNQWSHDNEWHNIEGVNWTGPLGAAFLIGIIGGAGYFFMKGSHARWVKDKLTPEFLLAYYALKKQSNAESDATLKSIQAIIDAHMAADKEERARIEGIKHLFDKHEQCINKKLENDNETTEESDSASQGFSIRPYWSCGYAVLAYYSYLHWLFWMVGTLVLYQSIKDYGLNPNDPPHSDAPGFFEGSKALIYVELLVPLIFSVVVVGYLFYQKYWHQNPLQVDATLAKQKEDALRAFYLSQSLQSVECADTEEKTYTHFTGAMVSTAATTFISHFILMNIVAWPLSGFFLEIGDGNPDDPMIIPYIFIATSFAAAVQVFYTVSDMHEQNKALDRGPILVSLAKVPENRWLSAPLYRFKAFYLEKDNRHKALYYTVGRILGSGGILLTRILFNGGMGNFRVYDGKPDTTSMDRLALLKIAAVVALAVIALNLYQYYKESERQTVLKAASDGQVRAKYTK